MNKAQNATYKLVSAAVVAALYAALTYALSFMSYDAIQFRVAEVLCILPLFMPSSVAGLFVGCILANLASPFGLIDVVSGSFATLLAALCTYYIGRSAARRGESPNWSECIAACAMPVIFNMPIVGAVLSYMLTPDSFWGSFPIFALEVGAGEAAVMFFLGLPLLRFLLKRPRYLAFLRRGAGADGRSV
ncbi:MAG: QueT transporter family protein [Oscillospiraceae bacterium]|jgi:uncharacterized membrane protein|nr:QueT transporter family protein [Oscillospiraceae bacterium]